MNTFDAIEQRRSVKLFDPEHRLTQAEIDKLMQAAAYSPTSFNIQNWRFVVVTNEDLRKEIRTAAWNQAQFTDASILVILTMDLKAHEKDPGRYWANADPQVRETLVGMIGGFYSNSPQLARDEGLRSCGIAGQTLMLAAKSMDLDSCPMVGFDFDRVGELIQLPEDHAIAFAISIGKALEPARPRGGQLPLDEVVIEDRFSSDA